MKTLILKEFVSSASDSWSSSCSETEERTLTDDSGKPDTPGTLGTADTTS